MDSRISIYIIESYNLTRTLYRRNLADEFEIKGEFKDEASCFKTFEASPSDIILMDLKFPDRKSVV